MALTGTDSIREVILFPHLKPKSQRMTKASAVPTIPNVPSQAANSFGQFIQRGELSDHPWGADGVIRESLGRQRDHDRHRRFACPA